MSKVLAIGLDSADRGLFEGWMDRGELPALAKLRARGLFAPLVNAGVAVAEFSWLPVLTGVSHRRAGCWSEYQYDPANYAVEDTSVAKAFERFPPFYGLGERAKVVAFDIPQSVPATGVDGLQVLAYGAHSPLHAQTSIPADVLPAMIRRHGPHPALERDDARTWRRGSMRRLYRRLMQGADRRVAICRDLMREREWDLFFTVFSEFHSGAHYFWHLSQPAHPLNPVFRGQVGVEDPMLEIARKLDSCVAELVAEAPEDCRVLVFSQEGMGPMNGEIASMVFLSELLYRHSFNGRFGFAGTPPGTNTPPAPLITHPRWLGWSRGMWALKHDSHALRRWARQILPIELGRLAEKLLGTASGPGYPYDFHPHIQIPLWFSAHWPEMKAFALPSFSEGYVRLNVRGREAKGTVDPRDFEATCAEIEALVRGLRNARSGEPMVKDVVRSRSQAHEPGNTHPSDLIVLWNDEPTDIAESPVYGRIGPVPYKRTGGHNPNGFAIFAGEGEHAVTLQTRPTYDVTATILAALGIPLPDYLEGRPLAA